MNQSRALSNIGLLQLRNKQLLNSLSRPLPPFYLALKIDDQDWLRPQILNISVLTFSRSWTKKGFQSGAIRSVKGRTMHDAEKRIHFFILQSLEFYYINILVKDWPEINSEIVTRLEIIPNFVMY